MGVRALFRAVSGSAVGLIGLITRGSMAAGIDSFSADLCHRLGAAFTIQRMNPTDGAWHGRVEHRRGPARPRRVCHSCGGALRGLCR